MTYQLLRTILGIAALVGFLTSLAVHFTALTGVDVASHIRGVWMLHMGIFLVFVRGFSGHRLVFFFIPAVYFLFGPKSKL